MASTNTQRSMSTSSFGSKEIHTGIENYGPLFRQIGRVVIFAIGASVGTSLAWQVAIAGAGFLADAYDLFVINVVLAMMVAAHYTPKLTEEYQAQISMMAIVGAITGQMLFGVLGDYFGRRSTFMTTAFLVIFGTIAQACVQMMMIRFIIGVGIGGEYPLASTITSETSETRMRGRNLAAIFSMQGWGRLLNSLVLLFSAFYIQDTTWNWRFALVMGCVPMLVAVYYRDFPETEVFVRDVENRLNLRERTITVMKVIWAHRVKLLGTAGSWFILDVIFYGNSLFSSDVTRAMGVETTIQGKTIQNLYIQLMALPAYILGIFAIDIVGRKRLQLIGFLGEVAIFGILAGFLTQIKPHRGLFISLYALTFFIDDIGANLTTFVIPAEIFPTEARSTCHGISAAFGKAGAAIGAYYFLKVKNFFCDGHVCTKHSPEHQVDQGLRYVFLACSLLGLLGFLWTLAFVTDEPHESLAEVDRLIDPDHLREKTMVEELVDGLEMGGGGHSKTKTPTRQQGATSLDSSSSSGGRQWPLLRRQLGDHTKMET